MTYKQNYRYIDKLQNFPNSYKYRTIDTEPANVTNLNEESVRLSTYFSKPHKNSLICRDSVLKLEIPS
jgi:hypothetical protein